eukprot:1697514-Rhodomonas_salina.1
MTKGLGNMVGPAMPVAWVGEPIPVPSTMTPATSCATDECTARTTTLPGLATQTQDDSAARRACAARNTATKPTREQTGWGGAGSLA